MKTRTCPNCGHQYSRFDYIKKLFFKNMYTNVECQNCKQEITVDLSRRIFVAIAFGFWMIFTNTAISSFDMNAVMWIIAISIFLIVTLYIFTFDTFKKADS